MKLVLINGLELGREERWDWNAIVLAFVRYTQFDAHLSGARAASSAVALEV